MLPCDNCVLLVIVIAEGASVKLNNTEKIDGVPKYP